MQNSFNEWLLALYKCCDFIRSFIRSDCNRSWSDSVTVSGNHRRSKRTTWGPSATLKGSRWGEETREAEVWMSLACSDASTHGAPVVSTPWTNIPTTTPTVRVAALPRFPSPHLSLAWRSWIHSNDKHLGRSSHNSSRGGTYSHPRWATTVWMMEGKIRG